VAMSVNAHAAHHNREARVAEQPDGEHEIALVVVDPDVINAHLNEQDDEQENVEYPRQPSPFLRIVRPSVGPVSSK
jgi:hypothetical protein